jgi:two-component system, LytTR family, response regulator
MMIKCLIADDEPLALDLLESYVRKTPFLELAGRCSSAIEALDVLNRIKVDLLFLDIQMPELSGMALSKMLKEDQRVIFTTAFEKYAIEGYKVDALDYLLKPFNYEEFLEAANKALKWIGDARDVKEAREIKSIFVKADYKLVKIDLDDILYVEGLKDYVKIYLESQTSPVISLMSMKLMVEILPVKSFMRVHRSYIVALAKIRTIERNRIVFGKEYIPVSENYVEKFREFISKSFFQ